MYDRLRTKTPSLPFAITLAFGSRRDLAIRAVASELTNARALRGGSPPLVLLAV
jgi:hypothetical protein